MAKDKILILGKIPPPIGGVTIHVSRLLDALRDTAYSHFHFLDLGRNSLFTILTSLLKFPVVHLNTSHVYFQLFTALLCLITKRKLILTFHGDLGRYRWFKNTMVNLSCRFCFVPIVQNQASLEKASLLNRRALLISAFIPSPVRASATPEINKLMLDFRSNYKYIFCTNACNLTFDKSGKEIYGISELVEKFSGIHQALLVISDPSGTYANYVKKRTNLTINICFLSTLKDFGVILMHSDAFIRNTSTDGDSISIHEAIAASTPVFATNAVPRPPECILYDDLSKIDFIQHLSIPQNDAPKPTLRLANVVDLLTTIYDECLNRP